MSNLSRYALAIAIGCLPSLSASAQTNAISFSNTTGESLAKTDSTFGWSFTANSDINVVDLGVFDDSQNGLTDSHQVGIWDSSGTLLVSATVPSGTGATLDDQFRTVSVSSTELLAGQKYFIGTLYTTFNDPLLLQGDALNFATASQITYDNATFALGTTLKILHPSPVLLRRFLGPRLSLRRSAARCQSREASCCWEQGCWDSRVCCERDGRVSR